MFKCMLGAAPRVGPFSLLGFQGYKVILHFLFTTALLYEDEDQPTKPRAVGNTETISNVDDLPSGSNTTIPRILTAHPIEPALLCDHWLQTMAVFSATHVCWSPNLCGANNVFPTLSYNNNSDSFCAHLPKEE